MNKNISTVLLVIISIWFWSSHNSLTNKISNLNNQIDSLNSDVSSYEDALSQANSNIEDAQYYADGSFYEMRDALENLETVEQ